MQTKNELVICPVCRNPGTPCAVCTSTGYMTVATKAAYFGRLISGLSIFREACIREKAEDARRAEIAQLTPAIAATNASPYESSL